MCVCGGGVLHQSALQRECIASPLIPTTTPPTFNSSCYHNNDTDKQQSKIGFAVSVQGTQKLELGANPLMAECDVHLSASYYMRKNEIITASSVRLQCPNAFFIFLKETSIFRCEIRCTFSSSVAQYSSDVLRNVCYCKCYG